MMQNGLQQSFHSGPDQFYGSGFGWSSGMALRQIMSHMDLSQYQNPGLDKSQSIENDYFSQTCSTPNSQTKSSCQSAESMDFEGSNSNSAWLRPQLWGATQVGVDVSIPEVSLVHDTSKKEELKESLWSNKDRRLSNESMTSFDQTELSEFTSADLCLASLPGCSFDPRTRSFSLEELKPQPIIRKRQKLYVEESQKSETYWNKRVINNVAARKSRDSRRLKENQIALRAAFLESENVNLKTQVEALSKTNDEMRMDVEKLMQSLRTLQKLKQLK